MCKCKGYIYTQYKISGIPEYITLSSKKEDIDFSKPVLIVGYSKAKSFIDNFSVLDKNPNDNMYWTFGKNEKRDVFEKDLEAFKSKILTDEAKSIKYVYVDCFLFNRKRIFKFFKYLNNGKLKLLASNNGMIYIKDECSIMGISLSMMRYCGLGEEKIQKIFRMIKNSENIEYIPFSLYENMAKENKLKNKSYMIPFSAI